MLVFVGAHNARILHYTDDTGLEADAVYQMADGRYALIEIKIGANNNPEHPKALYREPAALIVICATASVGYTTENGVKIVPVGCLRD